MNLKTSVVRQSSLGDKTMPKGKDGLFIRNKGIFNFRYKDENEVWRERSTGVVIRAQARQIKKKFLADLEDGAIPTPMAKLSVSKAADQWLESYRCYIIRKTQRSYKTCLTPVKKYFGDKRLGNITNADLLAYQNSRNDTGRHATTINHEVAAFSFVLREANLWNKLKAKYKPLPTDKQHSPREALTNEQMNRLVASGMSDSHLTFVLDLMLVAAGTTCRPCEIAGLTLGAIDVSDDHPHIKISRKSTKTPKGERQIPLNRVALFAIRRLLERAHKLGASNPEHYLLPDNMARHTKPDDPLYDNRFEGWNPNSHQKGWAYSWRKLREKAGLPDVEFYQLRHTSITAGGEQNVSLAVMKSLAGHMDNKMTDYYTDIRDNLKVQAVRAIESANPQLLILLGIECDPDAKIQ
jgi:integrase